MINPALRSRIKEVVRVLLGLLLLWAAVSKLANPNEFLGSIYAYDLPLPKTFFQMVAVILPWVELLCGLLLLANIWTHSALVCALVMMAIFVLATGQAWLRDLKISCGCFNLSILGLDSSNSSLAQFLESVRFAFFRNLVLAALTFFLFREYFFNMKSFPEPASRTPAPLPPMKGRHAKGLKR